MTSSHDAPWLDGRARRRCLAASAVAGLVLAGACQTTSDEAPTVTAAAEPRYAVSRVGEPVSFTNAVVPGAVEPPRQIRGLLARPEGAGPFPAVVLLHTCGGVRPHVSQDWPRYLASLGYVTLTVDSFGSRGLGACPNALHPQQPPMTNAYREITRDAFGALDHLATRPDVAADRVAVIGYSLGTNVINSFLIHLPPRPGRNFAAAIGIYGRCHDLRRHPTPATPLMQIAGELDEPHIGPCREVAGRIAVHVLAGAHHSWDDVQASGRRSGTASNELMMYSAPATARSRELVRDFLARHLGPPRPAART